MQTQRYDVAAARNVMNMLKRVSPDDHARLLARLKGQAGMNLGAAEEEQSGFWEGLFEKGGQVLTTIADYKLQEETARHQQDAYAEAVQQEMARQALLAEQSRTQQLEYQNQMELTRQTQELQRAAEAAKSRMNWGLIAAGGLGLLLVYRLFLA